MVKFNPGDKAWIIESTIFVVEVEIQPDEGVDPNELIQKGGRYEKPLQYDEWAGGGSGGEERLSRDLLPPVLSVPVPAGRGDHSGAFGFHVDTFFLGSCFELHFDSWFYKG